MSKRTIFIWDVHWCYDELKLLIKELKLSEEDKVFFVGDYINKWPKSFKVLKFLYKNKDQFFGVLWNHDYHFLEWVKWKEVSYWTKTFKKLKKKLEEYPEILNFYKNMPLYIENKNFILVHAWIENAIELNNQKIDILTSVREINKKLWYKNYNWDKKIIYWHNALDGLQIRENTVWLDSGCVYWKSLTAYVLETWEIYSQNALDNYVDVYKKIKNEFKPKTGRSKK